MTITLPAVMIAAGLGADTLLSAIRPALGRRRLALAAAAALLIAVSAALNAETYVRRFAGRCAFPGTAQQGARALSYLGRRHLPLE